MKISFLCILLLIISVEFICASEEDVVIKSDDDDDDSTQSFFRQMTISPIDKYENSPVNKVMWQSMIMVDTGTYTTGQECWESLYFHCFEALNFQLFEYIHTDGSHGGEKHIRGDGDFTEAFEMKLIEENTLHILIDCYILEFDLENPTHMDFYHLVQGWQIQDEENKTEKEEVETLLEDIVLVEDLEIQNTLAESLNILKKEKKAQRLNQELKAIFEDTISEEEEKETKKEVLNALQAEEEEKKAADKEQTEKFKKQKTAQKKNSSLCHCCKKNKEDIRTRK